MNILLCGQKHFALQVFHRLRQLPGIAVIAVAVPPGADALGKAAQQAGITVMNAGALTALTMPDNVDLIVCAHSHQFIGEATRLRARYGGIGFHPSLLPLYRGRSAIEWVIKLRERVTGGTVYQLSNTVDGGDVIAQQHVFIDKLDTAVRLWREKLQPLGVELLTQAVSQIAQAGWVYGQPQDHALATWFPSMSRPPLGRPDLKLLGSSNAI